MDHTNRCLSWRLKYDTTNFSVCVIWAAFLERLCQNPERTGAQRCLRRFDVDLHYKEDVEGKISLNFSDFDNVIQ